MILNNEETSTKAFLSMEPGIILANGNTGIYTNILLLSLIIIIIIEKKYIYIYTYFLIL